MASFDYDLAIIGAGSAGLTAARVGRFFAKRVAW
jgi:thioredoxin reductase